MTYDKWQARYLLTKSQACSHPPEKMPSFGSLNSHTPLIVHILLFAWLTELFWQSIVKSSWKRDVSDLQQKIQTEN